MTEAVKIILKPHKVYSTTTTRIFVMFNYAIRKMITFFNRHLIFIQLSNMKGARAIQLYVVSWHSVSRTHPHPPSPTRLPLLPPLLLWQLRPDEIR